MLITFPCPKCHTSLEIEAQACGAQVNCPTCGEALAVPRQGPGPGATVGGFRIEKLLGRGGMSEVYLARQISLDRQVALKILPSAMGMQKNLVERFLHEVKLLASLEHPNIVTAYEAGEDGGILYLAMAYVKGESLGERLDREGPLAEKEALAIMRKLATALNYAWKDHHLLHRDIKPGNILLDAAGEPKLADLGVSKSLDDASVLSLSGSVMGTPNYMSPEQASGEQATDFRTDMYALGATLYHMLTNKVPFAGSSVMETLHKQVTEPLPDPREANPAVSEASVSLMEIMLAKNPEDRYESWEGLIEDLDWVLAGNQPSRAAPAESTLMRVRASGGPATRRKAARRKKRAPLLAGIAAALVVAGAGSWAFLHSRASKPPAPPQAVQKAPAQDERLTRLDQEYTQLLKYREEHPDDYAGAASRLTQLQQDGAGTEIGKQAADSLQRMEAARQKAVDQALEALKTEVNQCVSAGKYAEALKHLKDYAGPFADKLAAARVELAQMVSEQESAAAKVAVAASTPAPAEDKEAPPPVTVAVPSQAEVDKANADAQWAEVRIAAAEKVLARKFDEAIAALQQAGSAKELAPRPGELGKLEQEIKEVSRLPEVVLAGFEPDIGKTVAIALTSGTGAWEVREVAGGKIEVRKNEGGGLVGRTLTYQDLSLPEKFRRLGQEQKPALEIMRGLLIFQGPKPGLAVSYFQKSGTDLGKGLVQRMERSLVESKEQAAQKAYGDLLAVVELSPSGKTPEELVRAIRRIAKSAKEVERIRGVAAKFREQHGASDAAKKNASVLTALAGIGTSPREVDQKVLDQAIEALKKANPRAKNLNPIVNMTEEGIDLNLSGNAEFRDLSPLAGLPIIKLDLSKCGVENIKALKGMPLQELNLSRCDVVDLSPLTGAPLTDLNLADNRRLENLAPIKGMPLKKLDLRACKIADLRPLQGMPLESLRLWFCHVQDLRPLKGMPLTIFALGSCSTIKSLNGLEGASLRTLTVGGCAELNDLSALRGARLESLVIDGCQNVSDISFAEGMPLKSVTLKNTAVKDLSPLRNAPVSTLWVEECPIGDVSGLSTCRQLHDVYLPIEARKIEALRNLPALRMIGYTYLSRKPAAEFWKEFDAAKK